jgi:hypothetical protein
MSYNGQCNKFTGQISHSRCWCTTACYSCTSHSEMKLNFSQCIVSHMFSSFSSSLFNNTVSIKTVDVLLTTLYMVKFWHFTICDPVYWCWLFLYPLVPYHETGFMEWWINEMKWKEQLINMELLVVWELAGHLYHWSDNDDEGRKDKRRIKTRSTTKLAVGSALSDWE